MQRGVNGYEFITRYHTANIPLIDLLIAAKSLQTTNHQPLVANEGEWWLSNLPHHINDEISYFCVVKLSHKIMETVVLLGNSKTDLKLLTDLAKKIGITVRYLNDDEKEDISLANAIKKGRTGKFVDTDKFIEKLSK